MKTITVIDTYGDRTVVGLSVLGNVWLRVFEEKYSECGCDTEKREIKGEAMFSVEQAKELRKALKRAIKASEAR